MHENILNTDGGKVYENRSHIIILPSAVLNMLIRDAFRSLT